MAKLILVPSGETEWRAQERLVGDVDLTLNEAGRKQAMAAAQAIAAEFPQVVRCGPEQATHQTASIIAHELSLKFRAVNELREVDLGIWEGLTVTEFSERYARVHKQWRLDATSVEPPDGEALPVAEARLLVGLKKVLKRHKSESVAVVLGPLAMAVLRCRLVEKTFERFWDFADEPQPHLLIEPQPTI